jgi:hypothetical protein
VDVHKKAKARSLAAYNGRETLGLEAAIDEQVKMLIHIIQTRYAKDLVTSSDQERKLLDLKAMTCYFTMDVITRLGFGKAVGYLEDEKDHYEFLETVDRLWPQISTIADVPSWIRKLLFSPFLLRLIGPKSSDKTGFGALMG